MSELTTTLTQTSTPTITPAETITLESGTVVQILQIIDTPASNLVEAVIDGIGLVKLDALSDENYDVPAEWTNADVATAVKNYIQS